MLKTFGVLKDALKVKNTKVSIDNLIFKLHYRCTFIILMVGCLLVTAQEYIGEHIRCITNMNDKDSQSLPPKVINRFCFFTSTYTVVKHLNASSLSGGLIPHPGVGPIAFNSDEEIIRHAYYQWVPFVLFGQALLFYFPHMIWKIKEGGRLRKLVIGLQLAALAFYDKPCKLENTEIPSKLDKEKSFQKIKQEFICKVHNQPWTVWLVTCEFLNLFNLLVNVYFTNIFLSGKFYKLGPHVMKYGLDSEVDILDEVFPKVTKCDFYKYGASGSLQKHDALCVMALNVINEKTYTFLWFWFLILGIVTILGLIWRILTRLLHKSNNYFNIFVFSHATPVKIDHDKIVAVTNGTDFGDWLFLYYIAINMDGYVFKELMNVLAATYPSPIMNTNSIGNTADIENEKQKMFEENEKDYLY